MAKLNVYVDGFNLYYGAVKGSPFKWLNIGALCQRMLPNDAIQSIEYFTAIVSARPGDPGVPVRQQMYLRALRTISNLTIVYGHFLTHSARMVLTGTNPAQKVWVDKTEEKGSDVNIAAHLLRDAFKAKFEVAAIITNDSRPTRTRPDCSAGIKSAHRNFESSPAPQRRPKVTSHVYEANTAIGCSGVPISQRS